ncbi:hypothetical protein MMC25_004467 [Agyrium rufum]|nr:hypothetical protein [Agyrium rufum]
MFARLSVILFVYDIFVVNRTRKWILWAFTAFVVASNVATFFSIFGVCDPPAKVFNILIEGSCKDQSTVLVINVYQGIVSVLCDWILALLPAVFLRDSNMPLKSKLAISALMGTGIFAGACAIVRTVYSVQRTSDATWLQVDEGTWKALETASAIIVANIPTLKPLFKSFMELHPTKSSRRTTKTGYELANAKLHADSYDSGESVSQLRRSKEERSSLGDSNVRDPYSIPEMESPPGTPKTEPEEAERGLRGGGGAHGCSGERNVF